MGGGKPGKPLQIPWQQMFGDRGDPEPELEFSRPASTMSSREEEAQVIDIPDHVLKEKIGRHRSTLSNLSIASKLPDKGEKVRAKLRALEEEMERREKRDSRSQTADLSSLQNHQTIASSFRSAPTSQSSFASLFLQKLKDKGKKNSLFAFHEEPGSIRRKNKRLKQREPQSFNAGWKSRMSIRSSSFRFPTSTTRRHNSVSSNGNSQCLSSRSHFLPHQKQYSSSQSSKGESACHCSSRHRDSIKDPDVVVLDEEDVQLIQLSEVASNRLKQAKIYYPSRDHPECVEICYLDIKCLEPQSYLSSTIMNFYIQYLQKPLSPIGRLRGEYHFFNTYFYNKLEEAVSYKGEETTSFAKLRRWLKGVNIFQKAYMFLPIHGNLHWSLVIICIPAKEEESGPVVLHLDSLGLHNSKLIFENIERYLKEEWNHICQNDSSLDLPISEGVWRNLSCRIIKKKMMVPQQKNEYDCGLFVLYFMERFIEEAPERVRMEDLDMFGSKWFRSEEASELRRRLRELLMEEFESARLENGEESSASSLEDGPL